MSVENSLTRFLRKCIVLPVLAAVLVTGAYAASVPSAVLDSAGSVVRVIAEYPDGYASGSGFILVSDGERTLAATNLHVVDEDPLSIFIFVGKDQIVSARIAASTEQKDMAVLELAYPVSLPALEISAKDAARGEKIYAVGFPGAADDFSDTLPQTSEEATITDGIVSAVRQLTMNSFAAPTTMLQINADINRGNSGGPLFNARGQVVGVNTLGRGDASGVFAAIASSELLTFLADSGIELPSGVSRSPGVLKAAAGAAALVVLLIAVVLIVRKRVKKTKTAAPAPVSLREYLQARPGGLGIAEAVCLLMPVLIQIREMQNNGAMHLQLSPDSVRVAGAAAAADAPGTAEHARYTSGFASPEVYKNAGITPASDVYSLCALLLFAASGVTAENALSRAAEAEPFPPESIPDEGFRRILARGMALDPEDRFSSVQELIAQLTPYNTAAPVRAEDTPAAKETGPQRSGRRWVRAAVLLVPAVLAGTYFGVWLAAESAADRGDFARASRYLLLPVPDKNLKPYVEAGLLLDKRDFTAANVAFGKLAGYKKAEGYAWDSLYRYAAQKADANDFATAVAQYRMLADNGYKDSGQKLLDTEFREGVWLLNTQNSYAEALKIFDSLADQGYEKAAEMAAETNYRWATELYLDEAKLIEGYQKMKTVQGYADADEILALMEQELYEVGQAYYADGNKQMARRYFRQISDYLRSDDYLFLIGQSDHENRSRKGFDRLVSLIGFEDAGSLLLIDQEYAELFLTGKWKKSNGSTVLTMEEDGSVTDDLPRVINGTVYYYFQDGYLKVYQGNDSAGAKNDKYFTVVDRNTIEVYCCKDGKTYTLYRK